MDLGTVRRTVPRSNGARPASFRPEIDLLGKITRVLVDQIGAVDAGRLGDLVGRVMPPDQFTEWVAE